MNMGNFVESDVTGETEVLICPSVTLSITNSGRTWAAAVGGRLLSYGKAQ
jgi:hypothetical protein